MWKDIKSTSSEEEHSNAEAPLLQMVPSGEDLSTSSNHSSATDQGNKSSSNLTVDRRSIMSQQSSARRASVRMTMPEESEEVNWVLNVFDPTVENIQEVYEF